tara:strand:+ start:1187 stop:1792 length:606 start_codon:yes stop_codon:yes gene_type:complete
MARVKYLEKQEVAEDLRWIYDKYGEEYGPFMNQVRVFAHRPVLLKHLMVMLLEMAEDSVLEKRHLEIALVTVSKLNECRYCVAHHVPRLVETGLQPATADKILDDDCPGLNELDILVRDYATQVTVDSKRVSDGLVSRLRAFFSEEQLVELTFRIALCGFYNRFNEALRIDIEDGVIEDLMAKGGNVSDLPMPLTELSAAE